MPQCLSSNRRFFKTLAGPQPALDTTGSEEFFEGPNFLKLCPVVLSYVQHLFPRAARPPSYGPAHLGANCAPVPTPSSPDKPFQLLSQTSLNKGKRWHSTVD